MSTGLIEVKGLAVNYAAKGDPIAALRGFDLNLAAGDTLALVGPTGCGKSTLLLSLAGLLTPASGQIRFAGDLLHRPHRRIALVLQEYGLFPWKTVRENAELGLKIRREFIDRKRTDVLMEELGLSHRQDFYPPQLSGGQKQRVALARALLCEPELLLLDEPFAAVDTLTRERLEDLLVSSWRIRKFAMIVVTHNIQEAVRLGRQIAVMRGAPGHLSHLLPNPDALSVRQRETDTFVQMGRRVRTALEDRS